MCYQPLDEYKSQAKFIELGGHQFAYWQHQVENAAGTILFVHGFPSASWDWHHQWQILSQGYNLLAMDMLGFGLSDKPIPHQYSLVEQAGFINQLLNSLHVDKCHVLAHDYGDSVAQHLLYMHQQGELGAQLSSVCFLNGGLFSEAHRPLLMQKLLKSFLGPVLVPLMSKHSLARSFNKIFAPQSPPKPEEIEAIWQLLQYNRGTRALPSLLKYIDERRAWRERWLQAMCSTRVPLRLLNGQHDPISGKHLADRYEELIPQADVVLIDAGHYPQLEQPQQVTQLFREFIAAVNS